MGVCVVGTTAGVYVTSTLDLCLKRALINAGFKRDTMRFTYSMHTYTRVHGRKVVIIMTITIVATTSCVLFKIIRVTAQNQRGK